MLPDDPTGCIRGEDDRRRASGTEQVVAGALTLLEAGRPDLQIRDAFEEPREALESHLRAEENLYFPTIWALRPEFKDRLRAFIRAHHHFGGLIQEITGRTDSRQAKEATHVLERLKDEFGSHQDGEEDALRSLDEQLLHDERILHDESP